MNDGLDFRIASIATFHVVVDGSSYWETYLDGRSSAAQRFLLAEGWRTVYPRSIESALCRVELADGTVGWGEANAPIAPEVTCLIGRNLLAPIVQDRDFGHPAALWDFLYDSQRGRGHQKGFFNDALAMLDMAVWDALGRRAGKPLAHLLCDDPRSTVPVYLSGLRQASRDERIATAKNWAEGGLGGIKIFLNGDTKAGVAELEALQKAVPEVGRWMVDVLWSYEDIEAASDAKAAYGSRGARWLECPLLPEDIPGHRELVRAPGAPIALGESFHTHHEAAAWFTPRATDVFQPDVGRCGVSDLMRQKAAAEACGISVTPHMGSGLDIFQAATLQIAATCGDDHLCEYQAALAGRLEGAVDSGWRYSDGGFVLPDRPGLGVTVHMDRLEAFVVR